MHARVCACVSQASNEGARPGGGRGGCALKPWIDGGNMGHTHSLTSERARDGENIISTRTEHARMPTHIGE